MKDSSNMTVNDLYAQSQLELAASREAHQREHAAHLATCGVLVELAHGTLQPSEVMIIQSADGGIAWKINRQEPQPEAPVIDAA